MVDEKTMLGMAEAESPQGKDRTEVHRKALGAKESADLEQLFSAYETAVTDRAAIEQSWCVMSKMLFEKGRGPSPEQTAINAIRDVALAAIELAKTVSATAVE